VKQNKNTGQEQKMDASKDEASDLQTDVEITREDLVSKLTELRDSMPYLGEEGPSVSDNTLKMLAAGVGLAAAYFYGRRRGRRHTAVVEVRRI